MTKPHLNQRVTFQESARMSDGAGGSTPIWSDLASVPTVWADVRPLVGRESLQSDRMNAVSSYLFTIRRRTDLSEAMRIIWNGEIYNIRMISREASRKLYMNIEAQRGVANS